MTRSPNQTKKIAAALAGEIIKRPPKISGALVLSLSGFLGSGKTTFVQAFIKAAGVKQRITSPTFLMIRRYGIKDLRFRNIYHMDAYRIKRADELLKLGLKEILGDPRNIVLIEWPEKIKKYLSKRAVMIKFKHGKKESERMINL